MKFCKNSKRGFTLVELLIAMAIGLVLIGALSKIFVTQRKTFDAQEQISEMIQNARAAMDLIANEVRMAGYNPEGSMQTTDPTAANFVGIPFDATQLEIRADLNRDGDSSDPNEHIIFTYDSDNDQIDRNTGGGDQPLAENIQAFTFQYFKDNGANATTAADIRSIKITITSRTSKPDTNYGQNGGYRTYTLTTYITPPNLALTGNLFYHNNRKHNGGKHQYSEYNRAKHHNHNGRGLYLERFDIGQ